MFVEFKQNVILKELTFFCLLIHIFRHVSITFLGYKRECWTSGLNEENEKIQLNYLQFVLVKIGLVPTKNLVLTTNYPYFNQKTHS